MSRYILSWTFTTYVECLEIFSLDIINQMSDYSFYHMARIGSDAVDNTQRNIYNTRFSGYTLSNYFSDSVSDNHVQFATQHPTLMYTGLNGATSFNGGLVDVDSMLMLKSQQERSLEKLSLEPRPFLTVPYLGRGSCNTLLETQMLVGEPTHGLKSSSTIMDKSFMDYALYPTDSKMKEQVSNPKYTVEEAALDGWVRGGMTSRDMMNDPAFGQNARPNMRF